MKNHSLTTEELASYRRDGFLVRNSMFDEDELSGLRAAVEYAVELAGSMAASGKSYHLDGRRFTDVGAMTVQFEPGPGSRRVRVIEPAHQLHRALEALIEDERIVAPMRDIIGTPQISVWTNKLNLKRPGEGTGFGWHQDSPYWIHDSDHVDDLPNAYLAFDDASEANGCLRIIRASHKAGCLPGRRDGSQLGGFFTHGDCFDEADAVPMETPSGSLVFFDPHCIHGSLPNDSDQPRRAMIMTYQPADFPMLKTGQIRNIRPFNGH